MAIISSKNATVALVRAATDLSCNISSVHDSSAILSTISIAAAFDLTKKSHVCCGTVINFGRVGENVWLLMVACQAGKSFVDRLVLQWLHRPITCVIFNDDD